MTSDTRSYQIPKPMTFEDVTALATMLGECRGNPVTVDASGAGQISARGAQLLLLATRTWDAEQIPFEISAPSDDFCEGLRKLDLWTALFEERNAA